MEKTLCRYPVVLGDLNIIRCLSIAKIPFISICTSGGEEGYYKFYARHCVGGFISSDPAIYPQKLLNDLVQLGQQLSAKGVLYYDNDQHLKLISENREELFNYYDFLIPRKKLIDVFLDKEKFSSWARERSFPVPRTYEINSTHLDKYQIPDLDFPVFVKPKIRIGWLTSRVVEQLGGKNFKGIKVNNIKQLMQILQLFEREKIQYMVQEYIEGEEDRIYSFHGLFDEDSNVLAFFAGKKIRTYPTRFGLSSYIELIEDRQLCELSIDLLKKIGFVGPVKIDYKKDANSDKYYLLEINARYNLWQYLGAYSGVNIPAMAFQYITNGSVSESPRAQYSTRYRWLYFREDALAFLELKKEKKITFIKWILSLMHRKIYNRFAWHDPLPFFMMIFVTFKHKFMKIFRIRPQTYSCEWFTASFLNNSFGMEK